MKFAKIPALFLQFREARTSIRMLISWEINSLTFRYRKGRKYSHKNITAHNFGNWTRFSFPAHITAYKKNQYESELESLTIPIKKTSFLMLLIGFFADFVTIIVFLSVVGWLWGISTMRKSLKFLTILTKSGKECRQIAKNRKEEQLKENN